MRDAFFSYRFNDAAITAYEYFWNDFCDWYVEATKLSMKNDDNAEKDRAAAVLLDVLTESLRLLHPLLPFVTEEIYQKIRGSGVNGQGSELLITSLYPDYIQARNSPQEEKNFSFLQTLVGMVRTLRSECGITPDKKLRVIIRSGEDTEKTFKDNEALIRLLAGINELTMEGKGVTQRPSNSVGMAGNGFEVFVFIAEAADTAALKKKFLNDLEKDAKYIESLQAKLSNGQYISNAPSRLVEEQKVKLEKTLSRVEKLKLYLRDL